MEDLLQSQMKESCKLGMPEGLKELMSDISREVLRTQPRDLYQLIADYLGALVQVRDTLSIARQICADTCNCACESAMHRKLQDIGISDDVDKAIEIAKKHLESGSDTNQNTYEDELDDTVREDIQEEIEDVDSEYSIEEALAGDLLDDN